MGNSIDENQSGKSGGNSFYTGLITGIGGVVLLVSSVVFFSNNDKKQIEENTNKALNSTDNLSESFLLDVSMENDVLFNTGSRIKVPADAFVDMNGNKVTGNVELKYREFHNVGEIILAKIPMTYDSAGTQYHFESAGMFEINAFQNGQPVFIAQDKGIQVALASLDNRKDKFNQYNYNEEGGKWDYIGKDAPTIVSAAQTGDTVKAGGSTFDLLKPVAKQKKQQQFTITISYDEFPELMAFEKVLFEVAPETKNFDPATASVKWDDVAIERIGKTNKYQLTFTNSSKTCEIIAYPVVDKGDLKKALAKWDDLYNSYRSKLNANEKAEEAKEKKLNAEISFSQKAVNFFKALAAKAENLRTAKGIGATEEIVYRVFQIKKMGIWNSDCPESLPKPAIVNAKYKTEEGKDLEIAMVYLIESGKNAAFTLYKGEKVYFDPDADNTLIVITKDNSIGRFTREDFRNLDKDTKAFTFKLKMTKKDYYTTNDITAFL